MTVIIKFFKKGDAMFTYYENIVLNLNSPIITYPREFEENKRETEVHIKANPEDQPSLLTLDQELQRRGVTGKYEDGEFIFNLDIEEVLIYADGTDITGFIE